MLELGTLNKACENQMGKQIEISLSAEKINECNDLIGHSVKRRYFLQAVGAGGIAAVSSSLISPFSWAQSVETNENAVTSNGGTPEEYTVWNSCYVNCGSRCLLKCHVKTVNDKKVLYWITSDDTGSDQFGQHQNRACLRGRSARRRVYNPDRLLYPMKRE